MPLTIVGYATKVRRLLMIQWTFSTVFYCITPDANVVHYNSLEFRMAIIHAQFFVIIVIRRTVCCINHMAQLQVHIHFTAGFRQEIVVSYITAIKKIN